jgi:LmbE family N-acetylglucosaminyl deacetylase
MNILAIGAHFDDIELGCGGSLLKWSEEGHKISIFVATKSGYRDSKGKIVRSDKEARSEGLKAAKYLKATLYEGKFDTFDIEFNESLNKKLLQVSKIVQPDLILTHWSDDIHHDHRALARASMHCFRHVGKFLMYRSNWYPSERDFNSKFFVDISKYVEKKVKVVRMHESEFERTRGRWEDFIRSEAAAAGLKAGCKHAEGFEVIKWLEK